MNMKAFPNEALEFRSGVGDRNGMDLRDYFAAKAMQGFMANSSIASNGGLATMLDDINAESAYKIADAMMKARRK